MTMRTYRAVISLVAASLALPAMAQGQGPGQPIPETVFRQQSEPVPTTPGTNAVTQRWVITSDPQYPRVEPEHGGGGDGNRSRSEWLINTQYYAVNAYRSANGGYNNVPVFINGDITEYYHGYQASKMKTLLSNLGSNYYYGLGNHDYENNIRNGSSGCAQNGCASQAIQDLLTHLRSIRPDAHDNYQEGGFAWKKWWGSQAYSKTIGDFIFIQLHNHPSYAVEFDDPFSFFEKFQYRITPSYGWLEAQLKTIQNKNKIPIINMHRSPNDSSYSQSDRDRFRNLVNQYGVKAIFFGHTHSAGKYSNFGNAQVFNSGSAIYQSFLVAEYDSSTGIVSVKQARDNIINNTPISSFRVLDSLPSPVIDYIGTTARIYFQQPPSEKYVSWELNYNGSVLSMDHGAPWHFNVPLQTTGPTTFSLTGIESNGTRSASFAGTLLETIPHPEINYIYNAARIYPQQPPSEKYVRWALSVNNGPWTWQNHSAPWYFQVPLQTGVHTSFKLKGSDRSGQESFILNGTLSQYTPEPIIDYVGTTARIYYQQPPYPEFPNERFVRWGLSINNDPWTWQDHGYPYYFEVPLQAGVQTPYKLLGMEKNGDFPSSFTGYLNLPYWTAHAPMNENTDNPANSTNTQTGAQPFGNSTPDQLKGEYYGPKDGTTPAEMERLQ